MAKGFKIADGYLDIDADSSKADRSISKFFRDTNGRLHDERGRFIKEGERSGLGFAQGLTRGAEAKSKSGFRGMLTKWSKSIAGAGLGIGKLFANKFMLAAVAGLGALPQAIGTLTSAVGGAINIGGAFAALAPAGIGALALTMMSLKTAFKGLGDALKAGLSGDMAAFAKATKDLAPAMQQAARAIVALNPMLKELRKTVQQNFWGRFVDDIKPLATTYLPMIYGAMSSIAAGFGMAAHEASQFLMQKDVAAGFSLALDSISQTVRNIAAGLPNIVSLFTTFFQVGAAFLPGITQGFEGITRNLAEWAKNAAATGQLQAFMEKGFGLAKQLGAALTDLLGILRSIGAAAPEGGLLASFGQLLDMVNRFFQTVQGQEALAAFFDKLTALGTLIMGLVSGALPGLLTISAALLQALTALAPIAPVVGKAIGDALTALAPILPVLGQVLALLLTLASGLLSTLAAELGPMISMWSQLAMQILPMLLPILTQLISTALPIIIEMGKAFADAWAPLIPVLIQIVNQIITGLVPYLPQLQEMASQVAPAFAEVAKQMGGALLDALTRLLPYIPDLVKLMLVLLTVFVKLASSYIINAVKVLGFLATVLITVAGWSAWLVAHLLKLPDAIVAVASAIWGFIKGAGKAIGSFFAWLGGFFASLPGKIWNGIKDLGSLIAKGVGAAIDWLSKIPGKIWDFLSKIPGMVQDFLSDAVYKFGYNVGLIIGYAISLPGRIWNALKDLWAIITNAVSSAWTAAVDWTSKKITELIAWAQGLPGRISNALSTLWSTITNAVSSAWNSAVDWTANKITEIVNWAKGLPTRVKNAITNLGGEILSVVTNAWNRARDGFSNGITNAINLAKSLPGKIKDALSGAGSWLYNVGRDAVNGLVDGLMSMLGWVRKKAGELAHGILDGAKHGLGINSPSKLMRDEVGKWIPPGIQAGIQAAWPKLDRYLDGTMASLANRPHNFTVTAPAVNVAPAAAPVLVVDGDQIATKIMTPERVAKANVEGARRRSYLNTGRAATA